MRCVYSATHLLHDPRHELQLGFRIPTHEVPERIEVIRAALESDGGFDLMAPTEHGDSPITAVHDPGLVRYLANAWVDWRAQREEPEAWPDTMLHAALREGMGPAPEPSGALARLGYWCFETMTALTPGTYQAARAAVDVALSASDLVLGGERSAYGLCRPPGHHAVRTAFGGYCYFNNAAIAAQYVVDRTEERVAVLDVDYHHGNGTQQIFFHRPDVLFVSLHGDPNRAYPYFAGYADETGAGEGRGANLNLPLSAGCTGDQYLAALDRALEAIEDFGCTMTIVSLGLDTYGTDPIADFALTTAHLHEIGRRVSRLDGGIIALQEGGYDVARLGVNATQWLRGLEDRPLQLGPV